MDGHTWGQIALGALTLLAGLYSSWDKWRIRRKVKSDEDKRADQLLEAQRIAAEALANYQKLISERLEQKIESVHSDLRENTQITAQAVEVSAKALSEANNFNAKFQVLAEADAERVLTGRLSELIVINKDDAAKEKTLHDVQKVSHDTNVHVKAVEQKVDEIVQLNRREG